jgi:hypothetical protein
MKLLFIVLVGMLLMCDAPGLSALILGGSENTLPEELKGLKIYNVSVGHGNYTQVAVLGARLIHSLT